MYNSREKRYKGLGTPLIRIPVNADHFIPADVKVVDLDVPFLMRLYFLVQHGMPIDSAHSFLISDVGEWSLWYESKPAHLFFSGREKYCIQTKNYARCSVISFIPSQRDCMQ